MKYAYLILAASVGVLAACSRLNEVNSDQKIDQEEGNLIEQLIFDVPTIHSLGEEGETRATLSQDDEGIHFAWETSDTVGIYPDQGAQVYFSMKGGEGTSTANFNGGGWALRERSTYTCYFPFVGSIYLDKNAIPVSFANQEFSLANQEQDDEETDESADAPNYKGVRFILASEGTSSSSGSLRFTFQILNTVIRIRAIGLPAGTYTKLSITTEEPLFVQKGSFGLESKEITGKTYSNTLEVSLKDFTLTEASTDDHSALVYLASAPVDLTGKTVTIRIYSSDGISYKYTTISNKNYEAGHWGGLKCEMEKESAIFYTSSDNNIVTPANPDAFGATITSNVYDGSKGILTFDGNVTQIGDHAFENCTSLTGITIPECVEIIGDHAFSGCTNLGADNTPANMSQLFRAPALFRSGETSFVIPDGVISIGDYAFQDCTSLTFIAIPESVETIGEGAFKGCTNLTSIDIPEGVTDIGDNAFNGCTSLTTVTIPDGVTSIDDYAFAGCVDLTGIDIPSTVTSIGKFAFKECSGLTSVILPAGVDTIGESAFEDCENLVSINIPTGVTKIEKKTFAACAALTSIVIPDGVKRIGPSAFDCCLVLANVSLPSSVEYIGDHAFASCHEFTTFSIPTNVTEINDGILMNCNNLSSISIHKYVVSIGYGAFYGCSALTHVVIPESVTSIGENAFSESGLTSITIPKNVESIGNWAFQDCLELSSIAVHAVTPPVILHDVFSEGAFQNTNDCPIYVPSGSLNAYKTAEVWSSYASRICDHVYVDMGNGMKWATTNVGAIGPDDLGDYFAWGGTVPLTSPSPSSGGSFTDTAHAIWGGNWRMPTLAEWQALKDNTNYTWIWDVDRKGYTVVSNVEGAVGNKIFLPAAGVIGEPGILYVGQEGNYWIPSTYSEGEGYCVTLEQGGVHISDYDYSAGLSVRPIYESTPNGGLEKPNDTGIEIEL